jgi:hypothetical protein
MAWPTLPSRKAARLAALLVVLTMTIMGSQYIWSYSIPDLASMLLPSKRYGPAQADFSIDDGFASPPAHSDARDDMRTHVGSIYEIEKQRLLSARGLNMSYVTQRMGSPENSLGETHQAYVQRLRTFVEEYFIGTEAEDYLHEMLDNLTNHIDGPLLDEPLPKKVWSTCKGGLAEAPGGFAKWEEKLGPSGWEVEVADDEDMNRWLSEATATSEPSNYTGKFESIWKQLPVPVLKTDLLR